MLKPVDCASIWSVMKQTDVIVDVHMESVGDGVAGLEVRDWFILSWFFLLDNCL